MAVHPRQLLDRTERVCGHGAAERGRTGIGPAWYAMDSLHAAFGWRLASASGGRSKHLGHWAGRPAAPGIVGFRCSPADYRLVDVHFRRGGEHGPSSALLA